MPNRDWPAQADLAYLFEQGKGVPLDYAAAYMWYAVAAATGERSVLARMKALTPLCGRTTAEAKARAAKWEAEHGQTADVRTEPTSLMSLSAKMKSAAKIREWKSKIPAAPAFPG